MQQVRSRIHDSIQSLHGVMPLWGVDHWVPLGDLFVDVNILESLSSSRRSELDDLWQDFTTGNSSYRSLDRIGLGKEQQRVSGLAVLERNTNLMVVGKPGSGKTTYLQRIVTECNDGKLQAQRIPVLIKLRDFVDDGRKYAYNLEQFLGQLWRLSNADIELVLNQGRALVLLDGLDEVTGEAGKQIAKEIKRFARAYPQVQVVVTCRTQSQESRFERFDYVEVANFNEKQVRAFAAHWFGTVCADAGETKTREFLEQLFREENKPIRELAITPILLSLTCAVFHQTGKFYSKRSKLYEEGLELLLVQWDKSREVERGEIYRDLSVERKLELLSYVAVKKFEQQQYVLFEQEELEGYIGEFLGIERRESRGVLQAIASQHGLLIERSHKVWSFSHLTFQEYLVAWKIVANLAYKSLIKHIFDKHWREVFLVTIEMLLKGDDLVYLMKHKIDKNLAKEEKIQEILKFLDEKSLSHNEEYRLSAIRAFFLEIFLDKDLSNLTLVNDVYRIIVHIPGNLDTASSHDQLLNLSIANIHHYSWYAYLANQLDKNLSYANLLQVGISPKIIDWWVGFENHAITLWALITEHSDISQTWQLDDKQQQLLQQYYDANKLLIDCLNSGSTVSEGVKQEIEDTLLLPMLEVEK